MDQASPFALVRASDYTDEQINSLWVELGSRVIEAIIEPQSSVSKFILGGKGTGKTHLLRYCSYQVARLRSPKESGLSILAKQKFLGIFLRATGLDAARFEAISDGTAKWQQLFGIYLELRLTEGVLDALCDIKGTSPGISFDEESFIAAIAEGITSGLAANCRTVGEFKDWVISQRRSIDDAVNNAAFVGTLELRVPFSLGAVCLSISSAIKRSCPDLSQVPLLYLIDEIENLSAAQQQVLNTLIRYGEGKATFRVTGRLYARKTSSTLSDGEENREGAEFKTTFLDDILQGYTRYPDFARKFVISRLHPSLTRRARRLGGPEFDPYSRFEEVDSSELYSAPISRLNVESSQYVKTFAEALRSATGKDAASTALVSNVVTTLTFGLPPLLAKLNILLFCKGTRRGEPNKDMATQIRNESLAYAAGERGPRTKYAGAYGHWAIDLFAQLCREAKKPVPYAGFGSFIRMSCGNPRNLLVILGYIYELATFKGIDFLSGTKIPVSLQTEALAEAARYMYESDTNYGGDSERARDAVDRLALLLRTARYALNIPEVSPLTVSLYGGDLSSEARQTLDAALNYSLVFEIREGRPDRNNERLNRKIQLNPLLSPKWGLPIGRRGDISLGKDLANAVFSPSCSDEFEFLLKGLGARWNNPFKSKANNGRQEPLPL